MKGTPGTAPLLISVQAQTDLGASPFGLEVFYADTLAEYPENKRDASSYIERVVRANTADGFQRVDASTADEISGVSFARVDFAKGVVHETVLVTTHSKYAFVLIVTGASVAATDKLIASTGIRLTR